MFQVSKKDINVEPFPYAVVDNALAIPFYNSLLNEFPLDRLLKQPMCKGRQDYSFAQFGKSDFDDFLKEASAWKQLLDYVRSPECFAWAFGLFSSFLEEYKCTSILNCEPDFSISLCSDGYQVIPHHDRRYHFIQIILYLGSNDIIGGGKLEIFKHLKNKGIEQYERYPELSDIELAKTISPADNRIVVWLNTSNSYHGTTKLRGHRRFLYIALNSMSNSCWSVGPNCREIEGNCKSIYRSQQPFIEVFAPKINE